VVVEISRDTRSTLVQEGPDVVRGTPLPRLRAVRIARLLTQQELARAAGVGFTTVNRLERGARPAELRTVRKLAAALGVAPAALGVAPAGRRRRGGRLPR
jgi:transcriptional regulator with XRE-family HTH domain